MALSFSTAPPPLWWPNRRDGSPNIDGYMLAFQDTARSVVKNVYQDAGGTIPYPIKIPFLASGQNGPFYFEVNTPSESSDPYFLEFYEENGSLITTITGFQPSGGGGGAPVTVNQDFNNLAPNGQFRFVQSTSITPVTVEQEIAYGGWVFAKTNASATDEIKFNTIALGAALPKNTPVREFEYECTLAGAGETEKFLEIRLVNVKTLEGQEINISFDAFSTLGLNEIDVRTFQFFGTGGAPSASVESPIATAILSPVYQTFSFGFVVPSAGGKILGTNGDDYLSFRFALPRNQLGNWHIVNVQPSLGSEAIPYQYQSNNEGAGELVPPIEPGFVNKALVIDPVGKLKWGEFLPIGFIGIWALDAVPANFLELDGASLLTADFPTLFALLGYTYGGAAANFNLPDYRGRFVRGTDNGAGLDPDEATRTPPAIGTFASTGSTQTDELKDHLHEIKSYDSNFSEGPLTYTSILSPEGTNTHSTELTGAAETRPINIYTKFIIKAL